MFNLVAVLELVIDGFNEVSFSEHELVPKGQQSVLHVLPNTGDQMNPLLPEREKKVGWRVYDD